MNSSDSSLLPFSKDWKFLSVVLGGLVFPVTVLALYIPAQDLDSELRFSSLLDQISRVTSLVGNSLVLLMFLLTSRAPWLEKLVGHDAAIGLHKNLSKTAFYLILLHFIASLWSYSASEGRDPLSELVHLFTHYQDLMTAILAVLIFVVVGLSSANISRRALKYHHWHLIHLFSYSSAILAVPHIFNMGSDLVEDSTQRTVWVFAYVFVAYNLVIFRLVLPLWRSLRADVRVARVEVENATVTSIYLSGKRLFRYPALPGQFLQVRFLTNRLWYQSHPFSISALPTDSEFRITVKNLGDGTQQIQKTLPGTRVLISGAFGSFTFLERRNRSIVLIAAGIGVAPIRALAEKAGMLGERVVMIYRFHSKEQAPLLSEMEDLAGRYSHQLVTVEGPRLAPGKWLSRTQESDERELSGLLPRTDLTDFYVCGPESFVQAARSTLKNLGVEPSNIHSEAFSW